MDLASKDLSIFTQKLSQICSSPSIPSSSLSQSLGPLPSTLALLQTSSKFGINRDSVQARQSQFTKNSISLSRLITKRLFSSSPDSGIRYLIFIFNISNISRYFLVIPINLSELLNILVSGLALYLVTFTVDCMIESNLSRFHALKMYSVIRDGKKSKIFAEDLVVGDLVRLKAGQLAPADILVVKAEGLYANDSFYSGKVREGTFDEELIRSNTEVLAGEAEGIVVAVGRLRSSYLRTGSNVFFEKDSQGQKFLAQVMDSLAFVSYFLAVLLFVVDLGVNVQDALQTGWKEKHLVELFDLFLFESVLFILAVPDALDKVFYFLCASRLIESRKCVNKVENFERIGELDVLVLDASNLCGSARKVKRVCVGLDEVLEFEQLSRINNDRAERISEVLTIWLEIREKDQNSKNDPNLTCFSEFLGKLTGRSKRLESQFDIKAGFYDEISDVSLFVVQVKKKVLVIAYGPGKHVIQVCGYAERAGQAVIKLTEIEKASMNLEFYLKSKQSSLSTFSFACKEMSIKDWIDLSGEQGQVDYKALVGNLTLIFSLALTAVLTQDQVLSVKKATESGLDIRLITENSMSEAVNFAKKTGILSNTYKRNADDKTVMDGIDLAINNKVLLDSPNFGSADHPINHSIASIKCLSGCDEAQKIIFMNKMNQLHGSVGLVKLKKPKNDWDSELVFSLSELDTLPYTVKTSRQIKKMVVEFVHQHLAYFCSFIWVFLVFSWKKGMILIQFYKIFHGFPIYIGLSLFSLWIRSKSVDKIVIKSIQDYKIRLKGIFICSIINFSAFCLYLFQLNQSKIFSLNSDDLIDHLQIFLLSLIIVQELANKSIWKLSYLPIFSLLCSILLLLISYLGPINFYRTLNPHSLITSVITALIPALIHKLILN